MSNNDAHTRLRNEILLAYGMRDDVLIWANPTGVGVNPKNGQWTTYGMKGRADILGVRLIETSAGAVGQAFAIEVKTGKGALTPEQRAWRDAFKARAGAYVEARDLDDVRKVLG